MGSPTAFNKKYKNGGLRRMLQQQHTSHTAESTLGPRTKLQRACSLRNEASDLRTDILKQCQHLCKVARSSSVADLQLAVTDVAKKVCCNVLCTLRSSLPWQPPFCAPPKGGRGCLMSPPCLESQSCHLIPLCYLLFFCLVLLPFLSYLFVSAGPFF